MKNILLLLVLAHILGDFYFQFKYMSDKKDKQFRYVLLHGAEYGLVVYAVIFLIYGVMAASYATIMVISHLLIDSIKFKVSQLIDRSDWNDIKRDKIQSAFYLIDQALHLIAVIWTAYYLAVINTLSVNVWLSGILGIFGLSGAFVLKWAASLLAISKPANTTIKKVIGTFKPKAEINIDSEEHKIQVSELDKPKETNDKNAGEMIGTIERMIMLILMSIQQYSAIALVLTAKSIARYNKIAEDPQFGEYYLLGTLTSTLLVIVFYILIF